MLSPMNRRPLAMLMAAALALGLAAVGCGGSRSKTRAENPENDPQHHYRWAVEQYSRGYYQEALESVDKAIALDPESYVYYNLRGLVFLNAGKPENAVADFGKVLELNPYNTDVHNNLGAAYVEMGRLDEARAEFEKVLADPLYRTKEKTHYNLGNIYFTAGDYEQALAEYRKAVVLKDDYLPAFYKMGLTLKALGRMEDARASFEEILRRAPHSDEAREVRMILQDLDAAS